MVLDPNRKRLGFFYAYGLLSRASSCSLTPPSVRTPPGVRRMSRRCTIRQWQARGGVAQRKHSGGSRLGVSSQEGGDGHGFRDCRTLH